jgi:hypothetical protein
MTEENNEPEDALDEKMTPQFNLMRQEMKAYFEGLSKEIKTVKPGANDDAKPETAPEIGALALAGDHKGEIYGGIFPKAYGGDDKPMWLSEEPKPMSHYDTVEMKGRALPTSKEGKYIDTIKDKGALKDIFARHSDSSSSAGFFWLAEHGNNVARYQQFSDGSQYDYYDFRHYPLPVLSVRR